MSTLADRLETLAANLQTQIDAKFADRSTNTPRKAQQAANTRLDGLHLERTQKALRALAEHHRSGTVPDLLAKLTTKKAIEDLTRSETTRGSGYYDAPRETGKPASNNPAALLLWSMIEDNGSDERRAAADLQQKLDHVRFRRIPGYFATPTKTVDILIDRVGLPEGETVKVLEPEAGSGNIADRIRTRFPKAELTLFEIAPALQEILKLKDYDLAGSDFLDADPQAVCDFVVMNPPFERDADIIHVLQALKWLKPGGRLVSIMSAGVKFRQNKRAAAFRQMVADSGGWFEDLPDDSFKESGTSVSTVLVVIEK